MRHRGFTLLEALVGTAIMALVLVGLLSLFDASTKISKAQTATSETQENLRYAISHVVRNARMTGSGGLPAVNLGLGAPIPGAFDIKDDTTGSISVGGLIPIVGTDILELRGAFTGDIVDLAGTYTYNGTVDTAGTGTVTIAPATVSGESQAGKIARLNEYFSEADADPIPIVITAPLRRDVSLDAGLSRAQSQYGTALLTGDAGADATGGHTYTFSASSGDPSHSYFLQLSPGGIFPPGIETPSRLTALDVVLFFVAYDDDGVPTLYRNASFGGGNQPLVSDVVDLQVAFGCDRNRDGVVTETVSGSGDEWLFNATGETLQDKANPSDTAPLIAYVNQLRITVVTRIPSADLQWDQSTQDPIFNENGRNLLADPPYQGVPASKYRYRALTERVKLRSLGPIY